MLGRKKRAKFINKKAAFQNLIGMLGRGNKMKKTEELKKGFKTL